MDSNALTNLPAVRLASGVEPQQKWPLNGMPNQDKLLGTPKLLELTPTRGNENTIVTVVVQTLPTQISVKLAFNSLMVDTKQMQAQGITSLVATVPSFHQTHSPSANVPVSICFLDKDMVTETWLVADFVYEDQKENTFVDYMDKRENTISVEKVDNNEFLNSTSYQSFYSPNTFQFGGGAAPVANYPMGGYPRPTMLNEKYQRQASMTGFNMNLFNNHTGFTSMLTSDLDQTSVSPMAYSALPTPPTPYGYKPHTPSTSVANYQPYPGLVSRANLDIAGDLDSMSKNWSSDEWDHRRRLVQFYREQNGNKISCSFQPVPQSERASNTTHIVVSCIYWMEHNDFFITSVDCIYLLECLMDLRFSVEEKNRIRRNLEGFRPLTVSKCKTESADFFKLIMGFPNPKPRNIEKDVKVFPWKTVPYALKKIVTKYTASSYGKHPRANAVRAPLLTPSYPTTPVTHGAKTGYFDAHFTDFSSLPGTPLEDEQKQ